MNQGGSEHPFQRLLTEFRQAHARHAKSPFVIELLSIKTLECEREWHPRDFLHIGKFLFTQQIKSMWVAPVVVCATVGSSPALEDMSPGAFYDSANQAWSEFELLATEAGAHLPLAITETLPDEPNDPLSLWFALLFARHPMHKEDLAEALRDRKILMRSPFRGSANSIELCKLNSDQACLPEELLSSRNTMLVLDERKSLSPADLPPERPSSDDATPSGTTKQKRSTINGEAHAKIVAGLTAHHKYKDGSCLEWTPVQVNKFAAHVKVSPSTVSKFFKDQFAGHKKYQTACCDPVKLAFTLRMLNGELTPRILYNSLGDDDGNLAAK